MKYIFLLLWIPIVSASQGITPALNKFIESEFFEDFIKLKERCEDRMTAFNNSKLYYSYSEQEITEVNKAYDDCGKKFNDILQIIKTDLVNKKMRKQIVSNTKAYSDNLKTRLTESEKYYHENFGVLLVKVTKGRLAGAGLSDILLTAISLIDACFQQYMLMKNEFNQYKATLVDTKFQHLYFKSANALSK